MEQKKENDTKDRGQVWIDKIDLKQHYHRDDYDYDYDYDYDLRL